MDCRAEANGLRHVAGHRLRHRAEDQNAALTDTSIPPPTKVSTHTGPRFGMRRELAQLHHGESYCKVKSQGQHFHAGLPLLTD